MAKNAEQIQRTISCTHIGAKLYAIVHFMEVCYNIYHMNISQKT